jgi:hypothetical protein
MQSLKLLTPLIVFTQLATAQYKSKLSIIKTGGKIK